MAGPNARILTAAFCIALLIGLVVLNLKYRPPEVSAITLNANAWADSSQFDEKIASILYLDSVTPLSILQIDSSGHAKLSEDKIIQGNPLTVATNLTMKRVILGYTEYFIPWSRAIGSFSGCHYNNCELTTDTSMLVRADVVLYEFKKLPHILPKLDPITRSKQLWMITMSESSARGYNQFGQNFNKRFNVSMTFRPDSTVYYNSYAPKNGVSERGTILETKNYSNGKMKGAIAFISNCESVGYNRLDTIKQLKKYIQVDLYGGCGATPPCSRSDHDCEHKLLSQYRFYLSFENSLCQNYITEKFWKRLNAESLLVPVVYGGVSQEDYFRLAPPNSFIHAYNFTSISKLGQYLKKLSTDDEAYNRYHQWREAYTMDMKSPPFPACKVCELANSKPYLPAIDNISEWWNNRTQCLDHSPM